jgi:hypothetical protein
VSDNKVAHIQDYRRKEQALTAARQLAGSATS